jgi:hypothetical protein
VLGKREYSLNVQLFVARFAELQLGGREFFPILLDVTEVLAIHMIGRDSNP